MKENNIDRRDFLRKMGLGSAAVASTALVSCNSNKSVKVSATTLTEGEMTYRINPNCGDKVSLLGYGCMRWQTDAEGNIDQDSVNELVDYAIEHGVNYFDTSPAYLRGMSERATGIALSRHPRDKYFIATKMSNFSADAWSSEEKKRNGERPDVYTLKAAKEMFENSLKDLQTTYIDYLLLHSLGALDVFENRFIKNGVLEYLLQEKAKGRIRNLGFSFHGNQDSFDYFMTLHEKYHWDFVQIQMNYVDWKHAKENNSRNTDAEYLYNELAKRDIPVVIMEPLLGGRLSKVPDYVANQLLQRDPERSVASWAFRFCGTYPKVLTALSGMTYMEHLQDNLKSFCPLVPLTEGDLEFLEGNAKVILKYPTVPCTDCKYCMPCPYGVDIPTVFAHYNKCVNEGNVSGSSRDENYAKARRAFLVGYDRSVPELRQASHCIGCHNCVTHCPQHISIPREMKRIDKYVEDLKQGKEF